MGIGYQVKGQIIQKHIHQGEAPSISSRNCVIDITNSPPERKNSDHCFCFIRHLRIRPQDTRSLGEARFAACSAARPAHLKTNLKKISHSFHPCDSFDLAEFQHLHLSFTLSGSFLCLMPADNG